MIVSFLGPGLFSGAYVGFGECTIAIVLAGAFFLGNTEVKTSGQIIATSHDLTPNGSLVRGFPLFQGNLGW